MKNILIPSTLQADTVDAVKAALNHAQSQNLRITLMMLHRQPDTFSAAGFLREAKPALTVAQTQVLEECHNIAATAPHTVLEVRDQYGLTGPLLKNLLQHLDTGLVILTPSYKAENCREDRECTRLLAKCRIPILHLGHGGTQEFYNALYLEQQQTRLGVQELQQMLAGKFNFRIVSSASVAEEQNPTDLTPYLSDAIAKNNINLLIETRQAEKSLLRKKQNATAAEALGLPVLSLYEEPVK